jgi:triacylglycerol lipase
LNEVLAVALIVGTSFVVGSGVYLFASFGMMLRHVSPRGFGPTLRELMREAFWVTLTQPLLPFFYFAGRRMGRGNGTPIVLLHGYAQNRVGFLYLARALRRSGLGPIYAHNYFWLRDIPSLAMGLGRFVDSVRSETGCRRVDLVCHSMGGLVAAHYLAHEGGADRVRRCVTIATPHKGVAYRGPIFGRAAKVLRAGHGIDKLPALPWLSLYSTHDNVVHPPSTSQLEGDLVENMAVGAAGHLAILFLPDTAAATARFLRAPDVAREETVAVVE